MKALINSSRWLQGAILAALAVASAQAQCLVNPGPNTPVFFRWENCTDMSMYADASLNNIPAGTGRTRTPSLNSQKVSPRNR